GLQRLDDVLMLFVHAENDDLLAPVRLLHVAHQTDAASSRHREVEKDNVARNGAKPRQKVVAVRRLADKTTLRLIGQDLLQSLSKDCVVVGNQYADHGMLIAMSPSKVASPGRECRHPGNC